MSREGVTIKLTKESYTGSPMFRKYDIVKTNILGRKQYNMILSEASEKYIVDEDGDNALSTTITLRKISKWLIIRKVQIFYYKNFQK